MIPLFRPVAGLLHTTPFLVLFYAVLLVALILLLTRRLWVERFFRWYREHFLAAAMSTLVVLFLLVFLAPDIFFTLGPGEVGVLWSRFDGGTHLGPPYPEGTFAKLPWDRIYRYDVRYQRANERVDASTSEGLSIMVDLVVRFRVIERQAGLLHKEVGQHYVTKLVLPELGAYARHVIARRTAEEVYGPQREAVQEEIFRAMRAKLPIHYDAEVNPAGARAAQSTDFVELEDLLIESAVLPARVKRAVESKVEQMFLDEEYDFRLARERKEMVRKGIEGEGIALFQSKVSEGISDRYLKWKGIDATLELAQSNNAKIVVIGSGKDGLPLILGGFPGDEPTAGAKPPRPSVGPPPGAPGGPHGSTAASPQGSGSAVVKPGGERRGDRHAAERGPTDPDRTTLVTAEQRLKRWLSGQADVKDVMDDSLRRTKAGMSRGTAANPGGGPPATGGAARTGERPAGEHPATGQETDGNRSKR
jgi:regulator of protease activity HflC (stomatin/prohibitin superfamily)